MKCNHCGQLIDLDNIYMRSFRLENRWVHYHITCFNNIIHECANNTVKPSPYKSINSSQCREPCDEVSK